MTVTAARLNLERTRLQAELLDSLDSYRAAKVRFTARSNALKRRYGQVDGEIRGKDDEPLRKAMGDCAWYAQEVQVAAASLTALNTVEDS